MVYRLSILGLAQYQQGHLEDAARYLEEGMALGAGLGARSPVLQALPAPTLALVRYEQGRLAEAKRVNAEHFDINRRVGPIDGLSGCYRVAARLARLQGQPAQALALLDDAERIATARGWGRVKAAVCVERIRHFLSDGRMVEANASIARLEMLAADAVHPDSERADLQRDVALSKAWRDLVTSVFDGTEPSLEALLQSVRANGKLLDALSIGTTLSLVYLGLDRTDEAIALFLGLCRQALAAGAVRSLLEQPVPPDVLIRLTLAQARRAKESAAVLAYLEQLVDSHLDVCRHTGAKVVEAETLSPREHRILQLISQGLSNKEIARNLGVTAETVKSHLKKIYPKLGVQNRAQAAARLAG